MNKLIYNENKIKKLANIIMKTFQDNEIEQYQIEVEKMQNYLKTKGARSVGPLIQYTKAFVNDNGELDMEIKLLLQSNNYLHNVEAQYHMESVIQPSDAVQTTTYMSTN